MADEADQTDSRIELLIAEGVYQARRAPALRPKGVCHFCDEPVESPKLFCDKACAQDFEEEEAQLKRAGRSW